MKLRTIACAMAAALVSTLLFGPYAAAHSGASAGALSAIPITGSFEGGTFTGTFDVERLSKKHGQLFAVGEVSGTLTYANGDTLSVDDVRARVPITNVSVSSGSHGPSTLAPSAQQDAGPGTQQAPGPSPQQAPGSCLVHLEFGGITLNIAGISLVISAFTLDLTLTGLLGNLLCGLLGVLGGAPPPAQAGILNQALGLNR